MNYSDIINQSIEKVYQNGIAAKILQHMDRIRNVSDIGQARRWIMELLQNSRDTAYPDQPVRVKAALYKDRLVFSHNGMPFRTKDILSIVNQVSSKSPDGSTVGQFGTGFMTTYQLSEIVEIQSVLKDEGLPYKPFSVKIDRRGVQKEDILASIFQTMEELKKADEERELRDFDREALNTRFIYHLEGERNYKIAKTGMDDLRETILYVLLFSGQIGSVELEYHRNGEVETIWFERGEDGPAGGAFRRLAIKETAEGSSGRKQREHQMIYGCQDNLTIAACMDAEKGFLKIPETVPRIFVDFPLIGAEKFPFPAVLNSREFKTNEPRSGITLVDNENSKDALANKAVMQRAVCLYGQFVHEMAHSGCQGLEHLVSIPAWRPDKEMSESWVKTHLYEAVYEIVSHEPLIQTSSGPVSLETDGMWLVSAPTQKEREGVKKLLSALKGCLTPEGDDGWLEAFAGYEQHKKKVKQLRDLLEQAQTLLSGSLDETRMPAMDWCRMLYRLGMENRETAAGISSGEMAVFPNQSEMDWKQRKLFRIYELYRSSEIPESLKDVSEELDQLPANEDKIRIREKLLHPEFLEAGVSQMQEYPVMELYNYISRRSNRNFRVVNFSACSEWCMSAWHHAWSRMLACCPDEELYRLASAGWHVELPEYEPLTQHTESFLWKNAYTGVLQEIIQDIRSQSCLAKVKTYFSRAAEGGFYRWYNGILQKAAEYINEFNSNIYPDQNGTLHFLEDLQKDGITHPELKEIAEGFAGFDDNCGIYGMLLDQEVTQMHACLHVCTDMELAQKISMAVNGLLTKQDLSEAEIAYQESCTKLLAWIQEHYAEAERLFPAFWKEEDQMRLLTAKAAVVIQKKANEYEKLLEELDTGSLQEAMDKIVQMRTAVQKAEVEAQEAGMQNPAQKIAYHFDGENDLIYDDSLSAFYQPDEMQKRLREIGKAGEQYAFMQLREYLMGQGYEPVWESAAEIRLAKDGEAGCVAVISYPDAQGAAQPGYDIRMAIQQKDIETVFYFEVKTHTTSSMVRDILYISNEQMKLAVKKKDAYYLLNVLFDYRSMQGIKIEAFQNPVDRIADGTLKNAENKYIFRVA